MSTPVIVPTFKEPLSPTRAEIDLDNVRHNVRVLQAAAAPAGLMGVMKANAYGHGAVRIAKTLRAEGVRYFAVATVPEALELRAAKLEAPILVFAAPLPAYLAAYAHHALTVTVTSQAVAEAVCQTAEQVGPLTVHIKVDTGMGRIGVLPEELPAIMARLQAAPGVTVEGVFTHFANATADQDPFTQRQWKRFEAAVRACAAPPPIVHTASSGVLFTLPQSVRAHPTMLARTGIGLYGPFCTDPWARPLDLRPVMRFVTQITHLQTVAAGAGISYGQRWVATRTTRIATLGAGYADGYPRLLTNRGEVGIRGQRYPVVGTICMDMLMVDLGPPQGAGMNIQVGDEAVFWGTGGPAVLDVAAQAETITYELFCGIAPRVRRVYRES